MTTKIDAYDTFVDTLKQKYPEMYSEPYGGVCVLPGWWPIIEALSNQIHHYVKWKQEQKEKYGKGEGCPTVVVNQIKEKFGGLRFYYSGGDDTIDGMVRMAESWACRSCEECGKPGKSRDGGWIRTLCDTHEAERQEQIRKRQND
jgi:hypothetical protein